MSTKRYAWDALLILCEAGNEKLVAEVVRYLRELEEENVSTASTHPGDVSKNGPNIDTAPRAHAVIRDGIVLAMAKRADYVEYLRTTYGDEVKEYALVPVGKEGAWARKLSFSRNRSTSGSS
jgi:hypothetical protein